MIITPPSGGFISGTIEPPKAYIDNVVDSCCSDNNLHFVEAPALAPPEVQYDQQDMIRYEQELNEAAAMPLPDEDDDL